jgi:hypothetical protein
MASSNIQPFLGRFRVYSLYSSIRDREFEVGFGLDVSSKQSVDIGDRSTKEYGAEGQ